MKTLRSSLSLLALAPLVPSASPQSGCAADAAVVSLGLATFGSAGLRELALGGVP